VTVFERFTLVAGPCVLEADALNLRIAERLAEISRRLDLPVVFKASFDKANRSRFDSERGPGLEAGLRRLETVRDRTGLPVLTDVHEPGQASVVAEAVDVLQIPAFLCRQTDLILAAAATRTPMNIKKGQWMAPEEMRAVVEKARRGGCETLVVTERGTFFGYGDLVVDMRSFRRIREACGVPTMFDGTHSVQRPGLAEGSSGGDPRHIPSLVRAAVAAGCDHLFLETHPDPGSAPSDGANMLPLERLEALLSEVLPLRPSRPEPSGGSEGAGTGAGR